MKQERGKHPWFARENHAGIRDSLVTAVLGASYATPRVKRKNHRRGPSPDGVPRKGSGTMKDPDSILLEIRRLHEQCGLSAARIRDHLAALGYSMKIERVHCITQYTTRSHLVPTPGAEPYFTGE